MSDADDYLDPNALMVLVALEKDPTIGLVFPDFYEVDESEILNLSAGTILNKLR